MNDFVGDLRYAVRMLWKSPSVTLAAIAALALGIGANTAIFSVVNAVLLKPAPFPDPDRLVFFETLGPRGSGTGVSPAKYQHFRAQDSVAGNVSAFRTGVVNYTGGDRPEQLRSGMVTPDFFRLFGGVTQLGRTFTDGEGLPKGGSVVILSHQLWARRFGSDRGVVGRSILISGDPHTVIGVMAPEFHFELFGEDRELWVPFQMEPNSSDQGHYFNAAGRLKPGVTVEQARAKLKLSAAEFRRKFPTALDGDETTFSATPVQESLVADARSSLLVLVGAVSFVLLIACSNVANLLLVRATGRRREIAIRAAIGAGRGRIIRQLLTESVLLSLAGGALGLGIGVVGIRGLLAVNTANIPRLGENGSAVTLDWRVLGFTLLISVVTGVLFGLIPALQASRTNLSVTLKESASRSGSGFRQNKTRSLLVICETALALILLVGAALLIRTAVALGAVDPGYDTHNVLTMRMSLTGGRFEKTAEVERLVHDSLERVRTIPGVAVAGAACCVPLGGAYVMQFVILGRPLDGPAHGFGSWMTTSPEYFDVFRIPLKRGRLFTERDTASGEQVVIINEAMARRFWKDGDPLHDRLMIGGGNMRELAAERPRQIVGVVGDVRDQGLNRDPRPAMYLPNAQIPDALNALNVRITPIAWVVRTHMDPPALMGPVQQELQRATGLPVSDVRSMEQVMSRSTSRQRFNMWAMSVFGGVALLLAAIGIYGLMAYSVEQRTQEIGIRLALGAQPGSVRNMVVMQGLRLALAGVVIGIASASGLSRFLRNFLFRVEVRDPLVFLSVPVLLSIVALLAIWFPARRATRVDPLVALRYE